MGLERMASVVQQVWSNYDTDLFAPIHDRMREVLGHDPEAFEAERFSYQVIADHSRAVTFLDRRRGAALQRGPRLRPPPDPAPRGPPRPAARAARAVPARDRRGRHRPDGRRLPAPGRATRDDPRRDPARGAAVRPDARCRHRPARGGAHPAHLGGARSSGGARRRSRTMRRCCPATSPSGCTTRTASRST